jgi:hypothetical protein
LNFKKIFYTSWHSKKNFVNFLKPLVSKLHHLN